MPIHAVLVDAGGTLVLPDHAIVAETFRSIGVEVDPACLDRAHYAGMAAFDRLAINEAGAARTYRRAYALEAGVPLDRLEDAVEALSRLTATTGHWTRPIPGARAALEAVQAAGLRIVVVSNTERGDAADQIARAGICQVGPGPDVPVVAVIDSAILGRAKPDPAMFEAALAAIDVPADNPRMALRKQTFAFDAYMLLEMPDSARAALDAVPAQYQESRTVTQRRELLGG